MILTATAVDVQLSLILEVVLAEASDAAGPGGAVSLRICDEHVLKSASHGKSAVCRFSVVFVTLLRVPSLISCCIPLFREKGALQQQIQKQNQRSW
jgi:hypothetical protein